MKSSGAERSGLLRVDFSESTRSLVQPPVILYTTGPEQPGCTQILCRHKGRFVRWALTNKPLNSILRRTIKQAKRGLSLEHLEERDELPSSQSEWY